MSVHQCALHGHRLEPRYDTTVSRDWVELMVRASEFSGEVPTDRAYVADVCARCGFTVRRKQEAGDA